MSGCCASGGDGWGVMHPSIQCPYTIGHCPQPWNYASSCGSCSPCMTSSAIPRRIFYGCESLCMPLINYQGASNYFYLPSADSGPRRKIIYYCNEPMVPGYGGHIPAFRYHSAARTFGNATRDLIHMAQFREAPCLCLPDRVWEQ